MKIATFQGPVVFGDAEANLSATEAALTEAEARGAEILAMPETFLHGFFSPQKFTPQYAIDLEGAWFRKNVLERFANFDGTLLLGLNERRGDGVLNTVAVIERGKLSGTYSKTYAYLSYETRGEQFPIFERRGIKFGIAICADTSYIEPARILAMKGAQIIFTPHFNYIDYDHLADHTTEVRNHHIAIAIDNGVYVARANVVVPESAGSGPLGYAGVGVGDSLILDRRGRVLAEAGISRRALLVAELPDDDLRKGGPQRWRNTSPAIAAALHDEYQQMFARHENMPLGK
ncbi:MAG TPA: carbon-nitrogen hydrolase family protein [Pirellulales bacterium]|nr:carbon-nitrogen hydrolase family protein [Pirellulales bacterium]